MMIAKCSFLEHKRKDTSKNSFHLIIDEAHNILSESSNRESETWKDYRLELFEEIIKEGRKFGYFVTIASQRPADISPTIISQIHNYFLHRLVNENDLFLLKNSISTLDSSSRALVPVLPAGACVVSGTAFHTPMVVQMQRLPSTLAPESDTIDLDSFW
ncbi:ATP-binding protein [Serratia odorifera]|nr:ATP-binding protein [Serratia odorifera]